MSENVYSDPPPPEEPIVPAGPIVLAHPRYGWPAEGMQGRLIPPPSRYGVHKGRPDAALFWECLQLPPVLPGAVKAWKWVKVPWYYIVEGVYYYGEGYYYDGCNYCYNGGFYFCPPPTGEVFNIVDTPLQNDGQ